MKLTQQQLADLYPGRVYVMKQPSLEPVLWKLKPGTRALFVLHEDEFRNKALTELLKKIVQSINLPTELAGFGVIIGPVEEAHIRKFPQENAVIFDDKLNCFGTNPWSENERSVFFAKRLQQLTASDADKRALWEYLKQLKQRLGL